MKETFLITLAVIARIVSNPLANVFQKQLTIKGNHPLLVNFLTYLLLSVVCCFFSGFVNWSALPYEFWLYSALGGMAGALGNGFLVKALQQGELSILGPINSYKAVVGIIVGIFLLHEIPNLFALGGIALIIYGSYFVLDTTNEKFSLALLKKKEIQFRLWAMILTAIEAVLLKKVILYSSSAISFISWCFTGAVFSAALLLFYGVDVKKETAKLHTADIGKYLVLILCIGIMQFSTNYTFDHMPVGFALSLFQLSTIVSVLLGYRIFKERNIAKKLLGAAIMIVGSVVVIVFKN